MELGKRRGGDAFVVAQPARVGAAPHGRGVAGHRGAERPTRSLTAVGARAAVLARADHRVGEVRVAVALRRRPDLHGVEATASEARLVVFNLLDGAEPSPGPHTRVRRLVKRRRVAARPAPCAVVPVGVRVSARGRAAGGGVAAGPLHAGGGALAPVARLEQRAIPLLLAPACNGDAF